MNFEEVFFEAWVWLVDVEGNPLTDPIPAVLKEVSPGKFVNVTPSPIPTPSGKVAAIRILDSVGFQHELPINGEWS